jgi:hypothetical protein
MAFSVNDAGTWKTVKKLSVYDGAWKAVKSGWINKAGVWTKFYASDTAITITGGNNIDLRSLYEAQTGDYSSSPVDISFIVTGDIGSTSTGTASIVTGSWPAGSNITLTNNAIIAGAGGRGGNAWAGQYYGENGSPGGSAISLSYNITINNLGTIGGGGGGGGGGSWFYPFNGGFLVTAGGGGGAGFSGGGAGVCNSPGNSSNNCQGGNAGTSSNGGAGGVYSYRFRSVTLTAYGGNGGNLGQSGTSGAPGNNNNNRAYPGAGGNAGSAIVRNGYTYTLVGNALVGAVS